MHSWCWPSNLQYMSELANPSPPALAADCPASCILVYLQVQIEDALGVVGEDDPLFEHSEAPLDRWYFAMNITKDQFFTQHANGRDGSTHSGGVHAGYW